MQSLSEDLRLRIVKSRTQAGTDAEVASRFAVSVQTVWRLYKQYREEGHVCPKQRGGYRRSRLAPHDHQLEAWIKEKPDTTLAELQARLAELGIKIGIAALWQRLNHLGLTFKKNPARQRAVARRRAGGAQ